MIRFLRFILRNQPRNLIIIILFPGEKFFGHKIIAFNKFYRFIQTSRVTLDTKLRGGNSLKLWWSSINFMMMLQFADSMKSFTLEDEQ
jgi:hypothetical protein